MNYSVKRLIQHTESFGTHDARWREGQPESLDKPAGEDELEFSLTVRKTMEQRFLGPELPRITSTLSGDKEVGRLSLKKYRSLSVLFTKRSYCCLNLL